MSKKFVSLVFISFFLPATPVFAMQEQEQYILQQGAKGLDRIQFQQKLFSEDTDQHLRKAGFSEGQKVWDIGCGPGEVTVRLARAVGPTGHVYAIDISQEQIDLAREKVKSAGLNNVTFFTGDVASFPFPAEEADGVYIRSVHLHLQNPESFIRTVKALLKKDAIVAAQEPDMSTHYLPSNHEVFQEVRAIGLAIGKKRGEDYRIGIRLKELYDKEGFSTEEYSVQKELDIPTMKTIFSLETKEWIPKAIAAGVLKQDRAEYWAKTVREWPEDSQETFHFAKFFFVIAKKNQ